MCTTLRVTATEDQIDWYIVTGGGSIQSGGPKIRKKMFDKRDVGKRAKKLLQEKSLTSAVNIRGAYISDMQLISNYNTVFEFLLCIFNFISHNHLLMKKTKRERQRERDRERQRERDRERQREIERQRETERQRDRETERDRERHRDTETERQRETERDRERQKPVESNLESIFKKAV